jgi:hypothetical protein
VPIAGTVVSDRSGAPASWLRHSRAAAARRLGTVLIVVSRRVRAAWSRRAVRIACPIAVTMALLPPAALVHHVYFDRSDLPDVAPFIRFEPPTAGEVLDARGTLILRVTDSAGATLYDAPGAAGTIAPAGLALIQEGLRGVIRLPGGIGHALDGRGFRIPVTRKTRTTSECRDALFSPAAPNRGDPAGTPRSGASAEARTTGRTTPTVPDHGDLREREVGPRPLARQAADARDVAAGLAVGRNAAMSGHARGAGVVAGDSEGHVAVEAVEQLAQVRDAAEDVLARIERVDHPHHPGGDGHQLHQALGPYPRDREGIEAGLGLDYRPHEVAADAAGRGCLVDERLEVPAIVVGQAEVRRDLHPGLFVGAGHARGAGRECQRNRHTGSGESPAALAAAAPDPAAGRRGLASIGGGQAAVGVTATRGTYRNGS